MEFVAIGSKPSISNPPAFEPIALPYQSRTHRVRVHLVSLDSTSNPSQNLASNPSQSHTSNPSRGHTSNPSWVASFEPTESTNHDDVSSIGSNAPRYMESKRSTRSEVRIDSKLALHVTTKSRATLVSKSSFQATGVRTQQPHREVNFEPCISPNLLIQMPWNFHRCLHTWWRMSTPNFTSIGWILDRFEWNSNWCQSGPKLPETVRMGPLTCQKRSPEFSAR